MLMQSLALSVKTHLKMQVLGKWSGLVTSFKAKLEKNKESHAYMLGVEAAKSGRSMVGPFERGSPADRDWVDGYLDYVFLRNV